MPKQRAQNDFGTFIDGLLRGLLRSLRGSPVVLDQQTDVLSIAFSDRHLRGVLQRLRGKARVAGRGQRQDERDLDLPGADFGGGLRRARLRFTGWLVAKEGTR